MKSSRPEKSDRFCSFIIEFIVMSGILQISLQLILK